MAWADIGFFDIPYSASRIAGMCTGAVVTYIIASPTILADWMYHLFRRSCCTPDADETQLAYEICIYDMPDLFTNERMFMEDLPKYSALYKGGMISKYPVGVAAEVAGNAVNLVVSGTTFVVTTLIEIALASALVVATAAIIMCATFITGLCFLLRAARVGIGQTFKETFDKIKGYV